MEIQNKELVEIHDLFTNVSLDQSNFIMFNQIHPTIASMEPSTKVGYVKSLFFSNYNEVTYIYITNTSRGEEIYKS